MLAIGKRHQAALPETASNEEIRNYANSSRKMARPARLERATVGSAICRDSPAPPCQHSQLVRACQGGRPTIIWLSVTARLLFGSLKKEIETIEMAEIVKVKAA